ncbi:MAG: insulinase family protein [Acidobacteriota bacterium]|nr:insulinase family protein [Acidobacteriota bacterium]
MKTRYLLTATFSLLLAALPAAAQTPDASAAQNHGVASNWKQIAIPPLPPFHPAEPRKLVLPNGLTIFLTENHELPLISGAATVRGGGDSESAEKTGLVDLYGSTWRTGGTEKLTGDQLDDFLEARAAKVETSGGDAHTSISFHCLKADFDGVFTIFADLLRHPAFREEKLALAKKQMYSSISRRNDESADIADTQEDILGYGKDSAYAAEPEYATVAAVTREDLLAWHKQHVAPNNIILGIVGDFDAKQMESTLRKAFADWPKGEPVAQPKVAISPARPGIYLVDKPDVNQSDVRLISLGIDRHSPDYSAVQVMNEIFGGGFSSRLFGNLRTKQGLAYSVYGHVGSQWDHQGLTVLGIATKSETTVEAIKGLWEQLDLMKKEPPSELEMQRARDSILNSFIFNIDTPSKVLREQQTYAFYGYPSDYLEEERAGIEKVTADDVLRVANKYLHREELKVLVVGNAEVFGKQLAALGPVENVDITIPAPDAPLKKPQPSGASTKSEAQPSGSTPEGLALLAKAFEGFGGKDAVMDVKLLRLRFKMNQGSVDIPVLRVLAYPDREVMLMHTPQNDLRQVVTPSLAFLTVDKRSTDLPSSVHQSELEGLKRDFLNVLQHSGNEGYTFRAAGKETVSGRETTILEISAGGIPVRWWLTANGELAQEEFTEVDPTGPVKTSIRYEGYKNFGKLRLPTSYLMHNHDGDTLMHLEEAEVNPTIDMKVFEREPAAAAK